jgi:uncharacterized protein YkwD
LALLFTSTAGARTLSAPESSILRAMNGVRAQHGLRPLRVDGALVEAARRHTADMVRRDYFSHGNFAARVRTFHARGPIFGENLAWGTGSYATARSIVAKWLASPPHRANLLRPGFTRIGLGTAVGKFAGAAGATVVTADFAGR